MAEKDFHDDYEQERAEAEEAARKAGYRGPKVEYLQDFEIRKLGLRKLEIHAPEGRYPDFDRVIRKTVDRRIFRSDWLEAGFSEFVIARSTFMGMASAGLRLALGHTAHYPQGIRDFKVIDQRLADLSEEMQRFVQHVPYEVAGLFVSAEESQGEYNKYEDMLDGAQQRLVAVHNALEAAVAAISKLRTQSEKVEYNHAGRTDWILVEFLRACAVSWQDITGKRPGKTTSGLFIEACLGAWRMFDWPESEDQDLRTQFEGRIKRGVHLDR